MTVLTYLLIFFTLSEFITIFDYMGLYKAEDFWRRYKTLTDKDLPVILKTEIPYSTLSTWRKKFIFPRANDAYKIANSLNTTVEYMVTGSDTINAFCSSAALEIAIIADQLSEEDLIILKTVVEKFTKL